MSRSSDQGLDILAVGSPYSEAIACDSGVPVNTVEETVTAGASSLSYDATTDTYTYVWKTDKSWKGTCRRLTVAFDDGSQHTTDFEF